MKNDVFLALDDVVQEIKKSSEYQNCMTLKKQMQNNPDLLAKIARIKYLQQSYVKSSFQNQKVKQELDALAEKLNTIPLYVEYNQNLEAVNEMIDTLRDELNQFFNDNMNILK